MAKKSSRGMGESQAGVSKSGNGSMPCTFPYASYGRPRVGSHEMHPLGGGHSSGRRRGHKSKGGY